MDSAGGSAKTARNKKNQAILSLRGKIINVRKASDKSIAENNEIQLMIKAFGTGICEDFDISKLKYFKIIIMTDADVDGSHIEILALNFIYKYMPQLIERGHVYKSVPPLYKIVKSDKTSIYLLDDEELEQWKKENLNEKILSMSRFKG